MKSYITCLLLPLIFCSVTIFSQEPSSDSIKFDYPKIYSFCLNADIRPALALIEVDQTKKISAQDTKFKKTFEDRFKYNEDKSDYLIEKKSDIDPLLKLFHSYWRNSMLTKVNYDTLFTDQLVDFFSKVNHQLVKKDSLAVCLKNYIQSKGLYTAGLGQTGGLYDLIVWKTQKDTIYSFKIKKEKISARVFMMDNFISLGWQEYATLNKYYPGGWATPVALYCVQKAYDLKSEAFLISYLTHEGRHFADYKIFPKLTSADLEYRAKLTELTVAKKTLYKLIEFFINNANYDSNNGHSVANFCVIRDLSKLIFATEFEKDINKWKAIRANKINKAAYKILLANTKSMHRIGGAAIEKYIKK